MTLMLGVSRKSLADVGERLDQIVADGDVDTDALGEELFQVLHVLDPAHSLRRVISDPSYAEDRKSELVRSLFGGHVGTETFDVLDAVVRARWSRGADLVDAVEAMAVTAEATRAERDGRLDDLEDELFRFRRIVQGQPRLRAALSDPALPAERKDELLRALLADKVTPPALRLATEVATHARGRTLDRGLEVYGDIVAERRRRLVALVRTAVPLSDEQRGRLAAVLASAYGHDVHLNVELDPDVMGGLSVQVGDEIIDGTIAGRLEEVRRRFSG
ncbi:MAG: F0F1 ATP synthase subunit delta [Streptosporangiaceae bacterium]